MDILSHKYVSSVLRLLYPDRILDKKGLRDAVRNPHYRDNLLELLEDEGYIMYGQHKDQRIRYMIALTDKGRALAKVLVEAENAAAEVENKERSRDRKEPSFRDGEVKPFYGTLKISNGWIEREKGHSYAHEYPIPVIIHVFRYKDGSGSGGEVSLKPSDIQLMELAKCLSDWSERNQLEILLDFDFR